MNTNTTDKVQVNDSTAGTGTSTTTTWHCPYIQPRAEQGWECPRCGHINAPWVRQCDCSRSNWTTTTTPDWIYKPDWWKEVTCGDADNVLNNPNMYQVGGSDYLNPNTKTYENVTTHVSNKIDPNSVTTAQSTYSTNTIHNGKTNYKE